MPGIPCSSSVNEKKKLGLYIVFLPFISIPGVRDNSHTSIFTDQDHGLRSKDQHMKQNKKKNKRGNKEDIFAPELQFMHIKVLKYVWCRLKHLKRRLLPAMISSD